MTPDTYYFDGQYFASKADLDDYLTDLEIRKMREEECDQDWLRDR